MIGVTLAFQTTLWLALGYLFLRTRNASVFHPFGYYWLFHGIVFVFWPVIAYAFDFETPYFVMWFYPTESQSLAALWLSSIGLFVFAIFSWVLDPSIPQFDRPLPNAFGANEWKAFFITAALLAPVGIYSAYFNLSRQAAGFAGDVVADVMERDPTTGIVGFTNTTGYFYEAQEALIPLCLMMIWGTRFRFYSFIPLAIFIADRLFVGWGRWTIILTLMIVALLFLVRRRARWVPMWIIIVAIPFFIAFKTLGENRDSFKAVFTGEVPVADVVATDQPWIERFDQLDFANFAYLTYVMDVVPEKAGSYSYFTQYLQLFTEPIPRILWPGKPFGPPIDWVNLNSYGNFVGLTTSLVGDGWISAGWLGVVITMAVVAYILSRTHRWYWRGEATHEKILTYCTLLPLTLQWFRDGGISISKFVLFTLGPIFLWHIIRRSLKSFDATSAARSTLREGGPAMPVGRQIGPPVNRA